MNLLRLNDYEFIEELSQAIHYDDWFADFLEPEVIERTRSALVDLKARINSQITKHEGDWDWRKRAVNKVRRVDSRLARVRQIRAANAVDVDKAMKIWRNFAYELIVALENSSADEMLDQIFVDSMSAREFLEARRRITAKKQMAG